MAIFNGRYSWDGTKTNGQSPIAWSAGAYDITLFQCAVSSGKVQHLKPYVCVFARTGEGQSISANPENFAKQICNDFSLELERVLWIEDLLTSEDRYEVVMFTRSGRIGKDYFYLTDKRQAFASEINMIEHELIELEALPERNVIKHDK